MDKIITYRAFDGTAFDNESECLQYEKEKKIVSNSGEKEIVEYLKHNQTIILSFLEKIQHYCEYFDEIGTCSACIFANENSCCCFGDMPEYIDIEALLNIIKENNENE